MTKPLDHLEVRIGKHADVMLVYCVPCSDYWVIPGYSFDRVRHSMKEFSKVHKTCTPGDNVVLRAQKADKARLKGAGRTWF